MKEAYLDTNDHLNGTMWKLTKQSNRSKMGEAYWSPESKLNDYHTEFDYLMTFGDKDNDYEIKVGSYVLVINYKPHELLFYVVVDGIEGTLYYEDFVTSEAYEQII